MTTSNGPRKVIVLGALSGMAVASARRFAEDGASLFLVARRGEALEREAADLKARGAASVTCSIQDLTDTADCDALYANASEAMGGLDTILVFYGVLGDQAEAERNPAEAARIVDTGYTSVVHWVLAGARRLEDEKTGRRGVLLTASSVAGDRGRRSNFVYGSAKAGLSVLMQGLDHKWVADADAPRAVNLKLGFVDTPMTDGLPKGGPLWAQPDDIAAIVHKAADTGKSTIYAPWFWRFIMLAIRMVPRFVFARVNL